MRKILILFWAILIILGLSACDGVTDGEKDTPESTETSTDEQGPTKRGRTVEEIDEVIIDSDVVKTTLKKHNLSSTWSGKGWKIHSQFRNWK